MKNELKLSMIIVVLNSLWIISCSEQKNQKITNNGKELKLNIGDTVAYVLPDGEKFSLAVNADGFDFLYLGNDSQFSINKSKKGLRTLASKLGVDSSEIADIDGDFYPDYKIEKSGTKELSVIEKGIKKEKGEAKLKDIDQQNKE